MNVESVQRSLPARKPILRALCYKRSVMALTRDLVPPVPPMSGVFTDAGTVASVSRMADSSLHPQTINLIMGS